MAGCDSGSTSSDVPPLAPLAYAGVMTSVDMSGLTVVQQKQLAASATRGVAVALQYLQYDRGLALDRLAKVVSSTGVAVLSAPNAATPLATPPPAPARKAALAIARAIARGVICW